MDPNASNNVAYVPLGGPQAGQDPAAIAHANALQAAAASGFGAVMPNSNNGGGGSEGVPQQQQPQPPGAAAAYMAQSISPSSPQVVVVDTKQPYQQPQPMVMTHIPAAAVGVAYHMDMMSDAQARANVTHTSSRAALQRQLTDAKEQVLATAKQNMHSLKDHMDLRDVLSKALAPGEQLLSVVGGGSVVGLDFMKLDFEWTDPATNPVMDRSKLPGQPPAGSAAGPASGTLAITDKRVLILCTKPCTSVAMVSQPAMTRDGKPKAYSVSASASETLHVFPVSLSAFTHVSLRADVGTDTNELVRSEQDECACLTCCCAKTWHRTASVPAVRNQRVLQFALHLPPWHRPAIMSVHCNPTTPLAFIQHIMTTFERAWKPDTTRAPATVTGAGVLPNAGGAAAVAAAGSFAPPAYPY